MKEVTAFKDNYGALHHRAIHAQRSDAIWAIRNWIGTAGIGRGGEWNPGMIADALIEGAAVLAPQLALIASIDREDGR